MERSSSDSRNAHALEIVSELCSDRQPCTSWEQRVLYDTFTDLAPLTTPLHVVRLSVYDRVAGRTLADCLHSPASTDISALSASSTNGSAVRDRERARLTRVVAVSVEEPALE